MLWQYCYPKKKKNGFLNTTIFFLLVEYTIPNPYPGLRLRLMTVRTAPSVTAVAVAAVYFVTAVIFLKFLVEVTILPLELYTLLTLYKGESFDVSLKII